MVQRLRAAGVVLALGAIVTCEFVWGDGARGRRDLPTAAPARGPSDEPPPSRFANQPAIAYQTSQGDLVFALQLQPRLDPAPKRPRDVLVMVDTSASQAARGLVQARGLVAGLAAGLAPADRLAVWTV